MDIKDQIRLNKKRHEIKETVTFKYIASYLLRDGVINNEDFQLIALNATTQMQMDSFLKILVAKAGKSSFHNFVISLEEDYPWLAEELKNMVVSQQEVELFQNSSPQGQYFKDLNSEKNQIRRICVDVISVLQQNARLIRRWTSLAYRLGLERQAQTIRVRVNINCEDVDQCVFHLMNEWMSSKPKDANLENLIRALKAEEFNDVAVQLESKFY